MRGLSAGQEYTITNRGKVVGRLIPASGSVLDSLVTRPATRRGGWSRIPRVTRTETTQSVLDELRAEG